MLQDSNYFTTFAFVSLMLDGERDFVFNRGADGQLSRAEIEAIDLDDFCFKEHYRKICSSVSIPTIAIFCLKITSKHLLINPGIF